MWTVICRVTHFPGDIVKEVCATTREEAIALASAQVERDTNEIRANVEIVSVTRGRSG